METPEFKKPTLLNEIENLGQTARFTIQFIKLMDAKIEIIKKYDIATIKTETRRKIVTANEELEEIIGDYGKTSAEVEAKKKKEELFKVERNFVETTRPDWLAVTKTFWRNLEKLGKMLRDDKINFAEENIQKLGVTLTSQTKIFEHRIFQLKEAAKEGSESEEVLNIISKIEKEAGDKVENNEDMDWLKNENTENGQKKSLGFIETKGVDDVINQYGKSKEI